MNHGIVGIENQRKNKGTDGMGCEDEQHTEQGGRACKGTDDKEIAKRILFPFYKKIEVN